MCLLKKSSIVSREDIKDSSFFFLVESSESGVEIKISYKMVETLVPWQYKTRLTDPFSQRAVAGGSVKLTLIDFFCE